MSWVIYQDDQDSQQRIYVTDIHEDSIGHFGGPGALEEAYEFEVEADAIRVLDWLNDPETFYSEQTIHMLEEKPCDR